MSGPSKSKRGASDAALGVRAHSGWAAYVVLKGDCEAPEIILRGRMELCDPKIKGSKQPYHEAEPMPFSRAATFIAQCRKSTDGFAARALAGISASTGPLRGCCVLTASGRPLPALEQILASHALIHSAEGEFYRDAVAAACEARDIPVQRVRERDLEATCISLPGVAAARVARLVAWGRQVGSPWRQDEKFAALGAWLALAGAPSRRKTVRVNA